MSIVCLAKRAFSLVLGQLPCTRLTCKTPVSSRSPRSFTKTRSLRDSRMRSNGSWIPLEEASMLRQRDRRAQVTLCSVARRASRCCPRDQDCSSAGTAAAWWRRSAYILACCPQHGPPSATMPVCIPQTSLPI